MTCFMKPLSCDPGRIRGMSERLIICHYENNVDTFMERSAGTMLNDSLLKLPKKRQM